MPVRLRTAVAVSILLLSLIITNVDAGYCVTAPALGFCADVVTYKVYTLKPLDELPATYFTELDDTARIESLALEEGQGCDGLLCVEHLCNKYFLKCNKEEDAPEKECYYPCFNCLSTCSGAEMHPGLAYQCKAKKYTTDCKAMNGASPLLSLASLTLTLIAALSVAAVLS